MRREVDGLGVAHLVCSANAFAIRSRSVQLSPDESVQFQPPLTLWALEERKENFVRSTTGVGKTHIAAGERLKPAEVQYALHQFEIRGGGHDFSKRGLDSAGHP